MHNGSEVGRNYGAIGSAPGRTAGANREGAAAQSDGTSPVEPPYFHAELRACLERMAQGEAARAGLSDSGRSSTNPSQEGGPAKPSSGERSSSGQSSPLVTSRLRDAETQTDDGGASDSKDNSSSKKAEKYWENWASNDDAERGQREELTMPAMNKIREWKANCGVCNTTNKLLVRCVTKLVSKMMTSPVPEDLRGVHSTGMLIKTNLIRKVVKDLGVHRRLKCELVKGHTEQGWTEKLIVEVFHLLTMEVSQTQMAVCEKEGQAQKEEIAKLKGEVAELKREVAELAQGMAGYQAASDEWHKHLERIAEASAAARAQLKGLTEASAAALEVWHTPRRHTMFKLGQQQNGESGSCSHTEAAPRLPHTGRGVRGRGKGR